jgi:ankyrin repeat protein
MFVPAIGYNHETEEFRMQHFRAISRSLIFSLPMEHPVMLPRSSYGEQLSWHFVRGSVLIFISKAAHFAKFKALRKGATRREIEIARRFPNQDFRNEFELSPILTAVLHEYDDDHPERPMLEVLLEFATRLSEMSGQQDWAGLRAQYRNRSPLFQELISYFESFNYSSDPTSAISSLLEWPDTVQRWTPLQWAAFVDREDEFVQLLASGADPFKITPSKRNLLHQAAESGTYNVLAFLLRNNYHKKGIDINLPDIWGETPLHLAAVKTATAVSMLVEHGAALNARQSELLSPLHYPFIAKDPERLALVDELSRHADSPLDAQDELGRTPLMSLVDSVPCVSLLLSRGADISISDHLGRNILHHACLEDKPRLLTFLLNAYQDPVYKLATQTDNDGDTPLLTSFKQYRPRCTKILLTRSPISTLVDREGCTLVYHAVSTGDVKIVILTLQIPGIDLWARTNSGNTVFDLLRERNYANHPIGEQIRLAAGLDRTIFAQMMQNSEKASMMWEIRASMK